MYDKTKLPCVPLHAYYKLSEHYNDLVCSNITKKLEILVFPILENDNIPNLLDMAQICLKSAKNFNNGHLCH